ncbi:MAG: DmsC/YnfH family molybdoenzyme membrane anchor subunit [Bacillota bacterium]
MGETNLLIFSICLQAAIGITLFSLLGGLLYRDKQFKTASYLAAFLAVMGILASFTHLGHPLSALNVFGGFGRSWLSNEAILAGIFAGLAVLNAVIVYLKPDDKGLITGITGLGSLLGLVVVFSMAKIYTTASVPAWQGINTYVDFYTTTIALGALLFLAAGFRSLRDANKKVFGYAILVAVAIQAATSIPHILNLNQMGLAAQDSLRVLNSISGLIWVKWVLVLSGAALLLLPANAGKISRKDKSPSKILFVAGMALVVGQIIGRYLFYAALVVMNVGLV